MRTILLVDDEPKVRRHLRTGLPWQQWGYRITGEASNGKEALQQCGLSAPDIVMIDVTMPVMDGLELLGELSRKYPNTRSIILTAHQDFHYAKQAMQLGAVGYLLKTPLDAEEVRSVLERAGKDVDKERSAQQSQLARQQLLKSYHYPVRQKYFEQLLTGLYATEDEIIRQADVIGIHLPFGSYTLLLCQMDELIAEGARYPDKDRPLVEFSTLELVREALDESAIGRYELFPIAYGQFIILCDAGRTPAAEIRSGIIQLARVMAEPLRKFMNIQLTVLAGDSYMHIKQTRSVFAAVRSKLPALFYVSRQCPAFTSELPALGTMPKEEWNRLAALWKEQATEGGPHHVTAWLQTAEKTLRLHQPHPEQVLAWLNTLVSNAAAAWQGTNSFARTPDASDNETSPIPAGCLQLEKTLLAVARWSDVWTKRLASSVEVRPEIAACLKFIREHLHEDLSVDAVAQQAQLSPSYLSHLFKKEVGATVNDYILEKRIEQAKVYLTSGQYLNYELIEKIGFRSYSYFCNVFKKSTGMTPNEYKRTHKPSISL
ncbi:response regulator transcription factor [Paenibacillus thalictri]|nr:response regulator [Paenibacillus thalictri]